MAEALNEIVLDKNQKSKSPKALKRRNTKGIMNKNFEMDETDAGSTKSNSKYQKVKSKAYEVRHKIAYFDPKKVGQHTEKKFHSKAVKYLFSMKYIKHTMIGQTLPKIVLFLLVYYLVWIVYKGVVHCNEADRQAFCKSARQWGDKHGRLYFIFSFLLGFYTSVIMTRWWNQILAMPNKDQVPSIAMVLNATVVPGSKGKESGEQFKRDIIKHCLLSWTMLMCNVSAQFKSVYGTQEAIIKKGIATEKEMEKISKKDDTSMAWLDKWWVPLNWCCHRIRVELEADGHLSGAVGYEALTKVLTLKSSFESILDYVEYPLPAICYQAVKVTSWFYLFSAALSAQNWCDEEKKDVPIDCYNDNVTMTMAMTMATMTNVTTTTMPSSADQYWWFFKRIPFHTLMSIVMLFAWLKMAEICSSPFDGDAFYDINLVEEFDVIIWGTSVALEPHDVNEKVENQSNIENNREYHPPSNLASRKISDAQNISNINPTFIPGISMGEPIGEHGQHS